MLPNLKLLCGVQTGGISAWAEVGKPHTAIPRLQPEFAGRSGNTISTLLYDCNAAMKSRWPVSSSSHHSRDAQGVSSQMVYISSLCMHPEGACAVGASCQAGSRGHSTDLKCTTSENLTTQECSLIRRAEIPMDMEHWNYQGVRMSRDESNEL